MSKAIVMEQYLGCSGYHYKSWRGKFYPDPLPMTKWLRYYSEHFNSLEINNSFYRLPTEKAFQGWYDQVPDNFVFTVKGSRYITHMKKLAKGPDLDRSLALIYDRAIFLKEKLGPILWQLPGMLKKDMVRLEGFCQSVSKAFNNVIEFRHPSWFDREVYDMMAKYKVTFCVISAPDDLSEEAVITTNTMYLRFHGKTAWYDYDYAEAELQAWVKTVNKLQPKELYAYFNNDWHVNAVFNCKTLQELLGKSK